MPNAGDMVVELLAGLILLPLLIAGIMLVFKKSNRPCPGCRAMIPDDATRCRHCGFGFVANSDASQHAPAGDCVMVPERGPLCSACVDAIISATTPTEQRP